MLSDGLAAFRAFLKSEFCEENIEFWLACEDFKKTKSPQKLSSKARKIYTDFIEKEAPKEVRKRYSCQHSLDVFTTVVTQELNIPIIGYMGRSMYGSLPQLSQHSSFSKIDSYNWSHITSFMFSY